MRTLTIAAVSALVAACGSASAADLRPMAPAAPAAAVMAPVYDWTGFYVGAHAGYGSGRARYQFLTDGWYNLAAGERVSHGMNGAMAGGHVGYNWQSGSLVFGLEGSFTWSDLQRRIVSPIFPAADFFTTRVEWVSTITPRFGIAANNWLFYLKGGVAFGEVFARIEDTVTFGGDFNQRRTTRVGWTIGGGVEYAMTPNWVIGVEGNYYDLGTFNVNQESTLAGGGPAGFGSDHDVRTSLWSVLGRISYRFGGHGGF